MLRRRSQPQTTSTYHMILSVGESGREKSRDRKASAAVAWGWGGGEGREPMEGCGQQEATEVSPRQRLSTFSISTAHISYCDYY